MRHAKFKSKDELILATVESVRLQRHHDIAKPCWKVDGNIKEVDYGLMKKVVGFVKLMRET